MSEASTRDRGARTSALAGFWLLAIALPLGLTLEALHALKVPVYFGSALRRELWTLAHAHGNLLGILCLCYSALAEKWIQDTGRRLRAARLLVAGSILMPVGFFAGGVLNFEGDPSLGIVIVPFGALMLFLALVTTALGVPRTTP